MEVMGHGVEAGVGSRAGVGAVLRKQLVKESDHAGQGRVGCCPYFRETLGGRVGCCTD